MTPRRCPFFGEIAERQHRNPQQSWRLFAAGAARARWRQAQLWMRTGWPGGTLLLPDADPASLRWPPGTCIADVSGLPGEIVHAVALALIRDHVTHAVLIDLADTARTTHIKPLPAQVAA